MGPLYASPRCTHYSATRTRDGLVDVCSKCEVPGYSFRLTLHVMPFLALPVRPGYRNGWIAYGVIMSALVVLIGYIGNFFFFSNRWHSPALLDVIALVLFLGISYFLLRHRYVLYLLLLAIPVKISLWFTHFKPVESFADIHARHISELLPRKERLQVLDVSTGSCNSLYRHGWMKLNADYTGLDLSETMLLQGLNFMSARPGLQKNSDFLRKKTSATL